MTSYVEEWRREGTWKSSLPDEFIAENKRLMWEFYFHSNGDPTQAFIEASKSVKGRLFIEHHLPYKIEYRWFNEAGDESRLPEDWLADQCTGAWNIFGANDQFIYFEIEYDAFWFKMTWV
jgi:hypothetical protein